MLYLPERTHSSLESKLLNAHQYTKSFKFDKNISDKDFNDKTTEIIFKYAKEGYYISSMHYSMEYSKMQEIRKICSSSLNKIRIDYNMDYAKKKLKIFFTNKRRCYCFNCKKFIIADLKEIEIYSDERFPSTCMLYTCPCCHTTSSSDDLKYKETNYSIFNECFLDGNKLKIKNKTICFKEYNDNILVETTLNVIVMNLDTGMTYSLPKMVNGKVKKGAKIINISYHNVSVPYLYSEKYNNNCKDIRDIYKKAFDMIRKYKTDYNGFYIPTLKEQLDFAAKNGISPSDLYDNRKYYEFTPKKSLLYVYSSNYKDFYSFDRPKIKLENLMMLNRFPALNYFIHNSFYKLDLYAISDSKDIKKIKKLRGQIKQNSKNPIKELSIKLNVPYTKTLKKFFERNISSMVAYSKLNKIGIKHDNIIKLFNCDNKNHCKASTSIANYFSEAYDMLKDLPTYNENNLFNKIVNTLEKENYRYSYILDIFSMFKQIRDDEDMKDYVIDLREDIRTIHDKLSSDLRKIRVKNKKIQYEEDQLKINGTFNGLHFALAKDTYELIDVGTIMHICVGSYRDRAINHSCYIVVARNDDNEPIICIEIHDDFITLAQTKLKYNSHPKKDSEEYKAILEWCNHANMLPINYEISSYNKSKQFLLDHKDLVEKYNKAANSYAVIDLDNINVDNNDEEEMLDEVREVI